MDRRRFTTRRSLGAKFSNVMSILLATNLASCLQFLTYQKKKRLIIARFTKNCKSDYHRKRVLWFCPRIGNRASSKSTRPCINGESEEEDCLALLSVMAYTLYDHRTPIYVDFRLTSICRVGAYFLCQSVLSQVVCSLWCPLVPYWKMVGWLFCSQSFDYIFDCRFIPFPLLLRKLGSVQTVFINLPKTVKIDLAVLEKSSSILSSRFRITATALSL